MTGTGTATVQVGPNGASGAAQGNANANGSANANGGAAANGGANANGGAGTGGRAAGGASGAGTGGAAGGAGGAAGGGGSASGSGRTGGQGNASGGGSGGGGAGGGASGGATGGSGGGAGGGSSDGGGGGGGSYEGPTAYSPPVRFGVGLTLCATLKVGVTSGFKGGPCFAVSFRWVPLIFEMETQLLFGGTRHSIDWVFPMSFVIPLTDQQSLYEGLQLRVGGSPIGATFASNDNGGSYVRFGLHAGLSYEWDVSEAIAWRVFDARAFLDFGTKPEVDRLGNFLDFGGQISTGIVF